MFVFHPLLGVVALGGSIVLLALAVVHDLATRPKLEDAGLQASQAASFMERSLRNAQTLEAMGMRASLQRCWLRQRNETIRLQAKVADRTGLFGGVTKSVRFLLQAALLGSGAVLVIDNQITAGAIVAASMLMSRALAPLEMTIGAWRQCVAARTAYARLNKLLEQSPSRPRRISLPAPKGVLQVQDVVAWLEGAPAPTLRRVSFKLAPGEVLAVIGSSGSGKSTLARLIVGAAAPYAGKVRLDNADINMWNKEELGSHLGYLSQDVELFDGTVAQNIARFGELESAKIVDAAQRAGVHDMILGLPQSYETRIGPGARALSGGQRQRIALARALYGNPVLVVLDEPNSSLDSEGEQALADAISRMKRSGTTVVLISHRSRILRQADHLLMLKDGTAVFVETWQQLQLQPSGQTGGVGRAKALRVMSNVLPLHRIADARKPPRRPTRRAAPRRSPSDWSIIALVFGGFGSWASLAPLSSAAIAPGTVVVDSSRKSVQHLEGGVIQEILVRDGDVVEAGQVLLRLDGASVRAAIASLQPLLATNRAQQARLEAERQGLDQIRSRTSCSRKLGTTPRRLRSSPGSSGSSRPGATRSRARRR